MTCTASDSTADRRPVREHRHCERHRAERGAGHGLGQLPLLRARTGRQHRESHERHRRRRAAGAVHHSRHLGDLDVRRHEHGEHSAGRRGRDGQPTGRHSGRPRRRHQRRQPARPHGDVDLHGYRRLRQRRSVRERRHGGGTRRRRRRLRSVALLRRAARDQHREVHERRRRRPAAGAQRPGGHSGHLDVRRHEHGEHHGLGHPSNGQRPGRRMHARRHQPRAGREHDVHRAATRPRSRASTRTPAP